MIFHISESFDCYFNLALEEIFLREFEDEVFMLWQNDNTIVVGKNQNTLAEINSDYVKSNGIRVVRRITGGGAVYHDMGNINFTYITKHNGEWESDFSRFAKPVIAALSELGLCAEISGRNDIIADGKKISGNAQTVINGRILHHGTLLFNTDVSVLSNALIPDEDKIKSKGIKSVSSRVANINELLGRKVSADELFALIKYQVKKLYNASDYGLTDETAARAERLADEKYRTWEWNYGYSPKYTFSKKKRFTGGTVNVCLHIEEGKIASAKIYGDFLGISDVGDIENALQGVYHRDGDILEVFNKFAIKDYFGNISAKELMEVFV